LNRSKNFTNSYSPSANHGLKDEDTGGFYPVMLDALKWCEGIFVRIWR
jgi:hypothetical protein